MQIIGVVDLRRGRAVHARGGVRANYLPIGTVAGHAVPEGDAVSVAKRYIDLGVRELYVADLDAITGSAVQRDHLQDLLACGIPLWVDAGVSSVEQARDVAALGVSRVIVGLETLPSFNALDEICDAVETLVAFSLDLRNGQPVGTATIGAGTPEAIALRASAAGVGAVIVLDLARVGSGNGVDLALLAQIRRAAPRVTLAAGGGIRDESDLIRLEHAGCDAALVGTALLTGRIAGTRNPEPGTRNPELGTRNPEPGTRTRNPEPGTPNQEP
jgi:phosphoribosylformimino-5-aminoimidazole carboxamide ribotide isomerase